MPLQPICGRYKEKGVFSPLEERAVVDFAQQEAAKTIGPMCDARYFIAGGAFKTLLTGRSPRDLDLWAPSSQDRKLVLTALMEKSMHKPKHLPFADAFEIDSRIVELSRKVEPDTLEKRLDRFDIALSAVGAEHRPDGRWRGVIHSLARVSVKRKEVLLLKPLVNQRWALATLERMRRYAAELGYSIPATEEAAIWHIFDKQPEGEKRKMVECFSRISTGGFGVHKEVLCRLQ